MLPLEPGIFLLSSSASELVSESFDPLLSSSDPDSDSEASSCFAYTQNVILFNKKCKKIP